jgi:hypothetical protein
MSIVGKTQPWTPQKENCWTVSTTGGVHTHMSFDSYASLACYKEYPMRAPVGFKRLLGRLGRRPHHQDCLSVAANSGRRERTSTVAAGRTEKTPLHTTRSGKQRRPRKPLSADLHFARYQNAFQNA